MLSQPLPLNAETIAQPLYWPTQIRDHEAAAARLAGTDLPTLMERAGAAIFGLARQRWPEARRWLVLCGGGNNGGDGYVVARLARAVGLEVRLVAATPVVDLKGDAAAAAAAFIASGGEPLAWEPSLLDGCQLVIDALLGSGASGPLRPPLAALCRAVNQRGLPLLAADLPTGLNGASGAADDDALVATLTVTLIGAKPGLYTGRGPAVAGEVVVAGLGVADELATLTTPAGALLAPNNPPLPPRLAVAHKGQGGRLLVIGGGHGMAGAARLAGEAALRVGAGLVAVGCAPENLPAIVASRPELMVSAIADEGALQPLLDWASQIAVGPGLGRDRWGEARWQQALASGKPLVVDGDALWWLAAAPLKRPDWVLTPHPGEAARLLGATLAEVEADRIGAVQQLVARYGGVVVLKGAGSLIGDECGWALSPWAIPAMATAGMGDLLTGIIAALRGQGLSAVDAARTGVILHARAAAAAAGGDRRGLLASDLMPWLRTFSNG